MLKRIMGYGRGEVLVGSDERLRAHLCCVAGWFAGLRRCREVL